MPVPAYRFASAVGGTAGGVIEGSGWVTNRAPGGPVLRRPHSDAPLPGPVADEAPAIDVRALADTGRERSAMAGRRWLGVDRAKMPGLRGDDAPAYGSFIGCLSDLDALGAGWFREGQHGDLLWRQIFGGQQIPAPAAMLEALTKDDFAAFADFNKRLSRAVTDHVRLLPMVFQAGSGTGVNSWTSEGSDFLCDPSTCGPCPVPPGSNDPAAAACRAMIYTYDDVKAGKPSHQPDVLIPAMWGWDPWYWDDADWPAHGIETEVNYQKFALNVYNPSTESLYMRLAASRKAMGIAAFGEAVGMLLSDWAKKLRRQGLDLADYVPFLELGAEWDSSWTQGGGTLADLDLVSAREYARYVGVLATSIQAHWSGARFKAAELGSTGLVNQIDESTAWLGAALSLGLPAEATAYNLCISLRAALSELVPVSAEWRLAWELAVIEPTLGLIELMRLLANSETILHFLLYALAKFKATGLSIVLNVLVQSAALDPVSAARITADPGLLFLLWAQDAARLDFPPEDKAILASDLVHAVGFHWFLWTSNSSSGLDGDNQYRNETYLQHRVVAALRTNIIEPCRVSLGRGLLWGAGNVGFPSASTAEHANPHATPTYQAAMLSRLLLACVGLGADHALWYSHMADLDSGGLFAKMGLRYDEGDAASFRASTDAFPKPSWFGFKRLTRLLAVTAEVEILVNGGESPDGVVLLRLTASAAGYDPGAIGGYSASGQTYSHAFIPCVDVRVERSTAFGDLSPTLTNTSVAWARFTLGLVGSSGKSRAPPFARLALAPAPTSPAGTEQFAGLDEARGGSMSYAASAALPDWRDEDESLLSGFGHTTQAVVVGSRSLDICVDASDGRSNPGLVAYFTNGRRGELVDHG